MKYFIPVLVILCLSVCYSNSRKLPSFVKQCKRHDPELNECVKNAMLDFRKYLPKGVKQMKLPPMDPYVLERSSFEASIGKAVFTNIQLHNSYDFEVDYLNIDLDNNTISVQLTQKYMELVGHYKLEGQFLQFGILGEGEFESNFTDTKTSTIMTGTKIQKKGKEYLQLDNVEFKLLVNSLEYFYLHDLFKDNPQITEWVHKLFNENMNELASEVMPLLEEIISKIYMSFFKSVFDAYSLDELFL